MAKLTEEQVYELEDAAKSGEYRADWTTQILDPEWEEVEQTMLSWHPNHQPIDDEEFHRLRIAFRNAYKEFAAYVNEVAREIII